ncbi:Fur family transcriptional regulator [Campylobacter sp. MIT 12-8780]|uniref:Fur family transcriptional regulator n=1 Tax=unclassified Campylobacter TaxID=2593542 RepID=UPI0010F88259|nr:MULTISPECIES: transcriptional repressor [unclassified Campylobacter]NDJ27812.1 transcriptional repressor [Campylobacter sp. MIT 19-121]TKX30314.1 Fur family transcriptional regulator [Campylobacter sp. MIT 12-5580]TQR40986.1 Fur family transcriptional regulator [Campylobacter sp. MIT 12-8780]
MNAVELLREQGIALTDLRLEMLEILANANEPLSFDDFHLEANKTTFYRNIQLFEEKGIVSKSTLERKSFYELALGAKAHFVCDVCHKITDFQMPKIKGKVKSVIAKGVCDQCDEEA